MPHGIMSRLTGSNGTNSDRPTLRTGEVRKGSQSSISQSSSHPKKMKTGTTIKKMPVSRTNHLAPMVLTDSDFGEQLVVTLDALKNGDFSARLPVSSTGFEGIVTECVNSIASRMERSNSNLQRLRQQVGEEGKIGERLSLGDSVGGWSDRIEAINALVDELSQPTADMGRVIGAVAKGDLTQTMPMEISGRPLK